QEQFPFYFSATINGASIKYEANDLNSQYECGISSPYSATGDEYDIYEGTFIQDGNDPLKNNIYVHILKYFNHYPSPTERLAMINLRNYPFGLSDVSTATINGASIIYADATGKEWSSEPGSQTGSTFSITELVDNPDNTSDKIFKATFSCKLYDGNGGSIGVNNAVIRGKAFIP
ncbi:MAG: hypothetical protein ACXWV6_12250, partial [Chitinophagaceae bacterium]